MNLTRLYNNNFTRMKISILNNVQQNNLVYNFNLITAYKSFEFKKKENVKNILHMYVLTLNFVQSYIVGQHQRGTFVCALMLIN